MNYEIISESIRHRIIAISDTEVGKIIFEPKLKFVNMITGEEISPSPFDIKIDMNDEIKKLVYANSINNLLVQFIRKDKSDQGLDMMVMERLYPIHYKSISNEERIVFFEIFLDQITELHKNGFLHGDIQQPVRGTPEQVFSNIVLTKNGLRLVDTGFSIIKSEEEDYKKYISIKMQDIHEIDNFRRYFLA